MMRKKLLSYRDRLGEWGNRPSKEAMESSIISNDCWGGSLSQEFGWEYRSPFVGLALMGPCYLHLLSNLERIINTPLRFKDVSRYQAENVQGSPSSNPYPIAVLGGYTDDVELHCIHYRTADEVVAKWTRRVERINWSRLVVKISGDKDYCTPELLQQFENLPYPIRIGFTRESYPDLPHIVQVGRYINNGGMLFKRSLCHFDLPLWLSTGKIRRYTKTTLANKLIYRFGV